MANTGIAIATFMGIRAAGSLHNNVRYGGVYYPAHTKNGRTVSARWEGNFIANSRDWTDANGQRQEGRRNTFRLIVWNSKNAPAGKGLADVFAKYVAAGKEISCTCEMESFMKRMFENGQPLINPSTGQPLEREAVAFRVTGNLIFGDDSSRHIAAEIANWKGQLVPFGARPQYWNVVGHADNEVWKQIVQLRQAAVWDGQSASYGYARIIVPEGAVVGTAPQPVQQSMPVQQPMPQPVMQQTVQPVQQVQQPVMTTTPQQPTTAVPQQQTVATVPTEMTAPPAQQVPPTTPQQATTVNCPI